MCHCNRQTGQQNCWTLESITEVLGTLNSRVYRGRSSQLPPLNTAELFAKIYEEGSATYVEDISALPLSHSDVAIKQLADLHDGLTHISNSVTLLELSVAGLNATEAVPFHDVYAVGFYGHGELYNIGYVMAKSIAEADGPEGLTAFLRLPPYKFVSRYTQLPKYGMDQDHPKLGPNTVNAAELLERGCK